jgi:hypothetical protein
MLAINAIADTAKPSFSIEAAMASKEMLAVRSLMAAANIAPTGKIIVAELDAKLANSRLSTQQRLELKVAMTRAGILV